MSAPPDQEFYRLVYQASRDAIVIINRQGRFLEANAAAEALVGYSAAELRQMTTDDLRASDKGLPRRNRTRVWRQGGTFEVELRHKKGHIVPVEITISPVFRGKTLQYVMGIARDITPRKQLQDTLRYQAHLLENISDAVISSDLDFNILSWNRAAEAIYGWRSEEVIGKPFAQLAQPEYPGQTRQEVIDQFFRNGYWKGEVIHKRKDGAPVHIQATVTLLTDSKGNPTGVVSTNHDITARKQAEEKLHRHTAQLELLHEAGRQLGQSLNPERVFDTIHGVIASLMPCDGLVVASYSDEDHLIRCVHMRHEGKPLDVSNFPPIPLEPTGHGTQSVAIRTGQSLILADFQKHRQTSQTSYYVGGDGTLSEETPEDEDITRSALIVPLKLEGRVTGTVQVFSYKLNDFTRDDLKILEALAPQIAAAMANANLYQQARREISERNRIEAELREHREQLENLVAERTAELNRRVEEVEQLNRALANMLEDLQASNDSLAQTTSRLQAVNQELGSFAYSVSHDLRAPLRSLNGFSQALMEDYAGKLDKTGLDYLQRIQAAANRMGQLIDDLLKLSRLTRSELHREPVNLSAIAGEIAAGLQQSSPDRRVEFTIQPDMVANGDARLLYVVLENLLGNAWKFTGGQSRAKIEFGRTKVDGLPAYFVRDNGAGFNMNYANKLFAPFQRLHTAAQFEGTGVGLATVQRIIHRHGGRVWAKGEVNRGATFYFTLET